MKRLLSLVLSMIVIFTPVSKVSALGGYEGGIYRKTHNNAANYTYEEVSFVTGNPAILKGTVTIKDVDEKKEDEKLQKEIQKIRRDQKKLNSKVNKNNKNKNKNKNNNGNNKNQKKDTENKPVLKQDPIPEPRIQQIIELKGGKISQNYNLQGTDSQGKAITLSRDVQIELNYKYYQGQRITTTKVTGYSETITTPDNVFTLNQDLSEITESEVTDRKPAIRYNAGNASFHKVFDANDNGKMIIEMDSRNAGYDEYWGATETKTLNYTINTYDIPNPVSGTYQVKVSKNTNKDFGYSENDPMRISFSGGYFITEKHHSAMEYNYDINNVEGRGNLELENTPEVKRLFAPVLVDIKEHYAEEEAKFITALGGFDPAKKNFLPASPISREEFARAILYSSGLFNKEDEKQKVLRQEIFSDVKRNNPNYKFIQKIVEKEMMIGRDGNKFEPKEPITRIEAIAILTNSLGLEKFIPNGIYQAGFQDEGAIPSWAHEAAYIAGEIGLVEKGGYINPNEYLTKADAAEMLARYTNYMINDLKEDYMYGQLNY